PFLAHRLSNSPSEALPLYHKAAELKPSDPRIWDSLLELHIQRGQLKEARNTVQSALKNLPEHAGYKALDADESVLEALVNVAPARPMLATLLSNVTSRQSAVEALKMLQQGIARKDATTKLVDNLRPLAERHPRFLELQLLLVRLHLAADRNDEALTIAARLMQAFPQSIEASEVATQAAAAANRWSEAMSSAKVWRERTPSQPCGPICGSPKLSSPNQSQGRHHRTETLPRSCLRAVP
ncbi:MAG: tetratricopeptide repeat protein, partial [Phycisphaerales bacterium]|nr:tetratricopeptide repeat protein [Phycisphaerales bacterium]